MARVQAASEETFDAVFVGGGLASILGSLALLTRHPDLRVAIVERAAELAGNHTWCFHAADVPERAASLMTPLIVQCWQGYSVHFPSRSRRLASSYSCLTSARLADVAHRTFAAAKGRELVLGQSARELHAHSVVLDDGRVLHAALVVDARGPAPTDAEAHGARRSGYQKFVGLELFAPRHALREPVLFDACLPQHDGFRFMYTLPLADDRLLIEETFFSDGPAIDERRSRAAILDYASARGFAVRDVLRAERGVLPMPWQDPDFSPDARPLLAGYRAGLFHPVTGYSVPIAVRFALALADSDLAQLAQHPDSPSPLGDFARAHAAQRPFLRLLTRMLFTCFAPDERYHVLEHFYRLPAPVIERFYAAELSSLDRARVLLGAPPRGFSLTRALRHSVGVAS